MVSAGPVSAPTTSAMVSAVPVSPPSVVSAARFCPIDPEVPPPPTFCEVNVAPSALRCPECVPGLFVCPAHLVACGAECFICCNFCLKVLCFNHMYCPCVEAVARRAWVSSLPPPSHQVLVMSPPPTITSTPVAVPGPSGLVSPVLSPGLDLSLEPVVFVFVFPDDDDSFSVFSETTNNDNSHDGP